VGIVGKKQLNLGELIDLLKQIERDDLTSVEFDFCGIAPGRLHSYRGYYEQLAIEPDNIYVLLDPFIADLEIAVGQTYEGYKGGDFTMHRDTPVWISSYGEAKNTVITGVKKIYNQVILKTRYQE
jgi:hypothetical protein